MKQLLFCFVLLLLLSGRASYAQQDSVQKRVPIYISLGYGQAYGHVLPSGGSHFSIGLNVAGLFRQNYFLGVFLEGRISKLFCINRRYGRIRSSVEDNLIYTQPGYADSLRVQFLYDAFNSHPRRHFGDGYHVAYGIAFSPYPDQYGGLLLKVKRGRNELGIQGAYGHDALDYETDDHIYLTVPFDFSFELVSKPLLFIASRPKQQWLVMVCKGLQLGFFYNRVNMNRAKLNKSPLHNFLAPEFFAENGFSNHFGFTVNFGYY